MNTKSPRNASAQRGFTLLEVLVATFIMTVGLLGTAQLFIAASFLNSLNGNTSHSLSEAERITENLKIVAATASSQALVDAQLTSTVTQPDTKATNPTRTEVYVLDDSGALVQTGSSVSLPSDLAATYGPNKTRAPSARTRLVIVRFTPTQLNERVNDTVTLVATVEMKESYS
jgi:prepilin-type N-terminal cleavage/methylation domain-containing protein